MTLTPDTEINETVQATEIQCGPGDGLYIYVPNEYNLPLIIFYKQLTRIKGEFEAKFPNLTIVVSANDIKFTVLTKKQVFTHKLTGNIK